MNFKENIEAEIRRKKQEQGEREARSRAEREQQEWALEQFRNSCFAIPDKVGATRMLDEIRRDVWRGLGKIESYGPIQIWSYGPVENGLGLVIKGSALVYPYQFPDIKSVTHYKRVFGKYWEPGGNYLDGRSNVSFEKVGWHEEYDSTERKLVWESRELKISIQTEENSYHHSFTLRAATNLLPLGLWNVTDFSTLEDFVQRSLLGNCVYMVENGNVPYLIKNKVDEELKRLGMG